MTGVAVRRFLPAIAFSALSVALLFLIASAMTTARAPAIQTSFGGASVDIRTDSAWALPFECVAIRWTLEGIRGFFIDGQGHIGFGEKAFCPSLFSTSAHIKIIAWDETVREFTLDFRYLPTELLAAALLFTLPSLILLALWILKFFRLDAPLPFRRWMPPLYVVAILVVLFGAASDTLSIASLVDALANVFSNPLWHYAGIIPALIVFVPLAADALQRGVKSGARMDMVAVAALAGLVALLYLEFGMETLPEWEGWDDNSYLNGTTDLRRYEILTRYWRLVYNGVANILDPHSFVGLRLVNAGLLWGKLALFYGILRRLKAPPLLAFLCAALYLAYPVNPRLMSLRQANMNFNELCIFAAGYLALNCLESPRRLRLAGMWLALLFVIGSYEVGVVLIGLAPALWWLGSRSSVQGRFNMTLLWFGAIALPMSYLVLAVTVGLETRNDGLSRVVLASGRPALEIAAHYADLLVRYYRETFVNGWADSIAALGGNQWLPSTFGALLLVGGVGAWLARGNGAMPFPSRRVIAACFCSGVLYVLASVGFFMWFESFNRGDWRIYALTAAGGAIVVFSLILTLAALFKRPRWRDGLLIALVVALLFPALSRLLAQHEFFVGRARNHKIVLTGVMAQAPAFNAAAWAVLVADMDYSEIRQTQLYPFRYNLVRVMRTLYGDASPARFDFCWAGGRVCNFGLGDVSHADIADTVAIRGVSQFVFFRLHDDLGVELLQELPPQLGIADADLYAPSRHINFDAPLPPRAATMLGLAK